MLTFPYTYKIDHVVRLQRDAGKLFSDMFILV